MKLIRKIEEMYFNGRLMPVLVIIVGAISLITFFITLFTLLEISLLH